MKVNLIECKITASNSLSKAHQLYLVDDIKIEITSKFVIEKVHTPTNFKNAANQDYGDNRLLLSDNKVKMQVKTSMNWEKQDLGLEKILSI